jgi:uncharacterized lipoprotein
VVQKFLNYYSKEWNGTAKLKVLEKTSDRVWKRVAQMLQRHVAIRDKNKQRSMIPQFAEQQEKQEEKSERTAEDRILNGVLTTRRKRLFVCFGYI